jgi:hypothetical protein
MQHTARNSALNQRSIPRFIAALKVRNSLYGIALVAHKDSARDLPRSH